MGKTAEAAATKSQIEGWRRDLKKAEARVKEFRAEAGRTDRYADRAAARYLLAQAESSATSCRRAIRQLGEWSK
jgi:hypothetical protein